MATNATPRESAGKATGEPKSNENNDRPQRKDKDPDLLLSQFTLGCLTVVNGSGPGAEIALAKCANKLDQKWTSVGDVLIWEGNPSCCLVPDYEKKVVTLGDVSVSPAEWVYDSKERFVVDGTNALFVPSEKPRTAVTLHPLRDNQNEKWWKFSDLDAMLDGAPPAQYPVPDTDITTYKQELARGLNNGFTSATKPLPYERDVATFPGIVPSSTPRVGRTLVLDLSVLGQIRDFRMTLPQDWQVTDLYAAAGDVVEIIIPDSLSVERASQIAVRVGAHVDFLKDTSTNVTQKHQWKRMPIVTETFELQPGVNKIRSQYGGHLIFMFTEGDNFKVEAEVKNVVESPYFRLGATTTAQWKKELEKETPYVILETDKVVVVIAASDAKNVTDPDSLMKRYDEVISMLNFAAGFDGTEIPPRGKYWLVNDIQITAGTAHAGFPAMFDRSYNDLGSGDTPYDWVTWHELGHNYQQKPYWENAYFVETTVNLFSLYIQDQLFGEDQLEQRDKYNKTADAVDAGLTYDDADVWQKLVFLMEIKYAFPETGWEMYRQLRKVTRALSEEDAEDLKNPGHHQKRLDHVYKNLSKSVGSDLIGTYKRWGITISQEAQGEIAALGLPKAPEDLSHRT
ncbi:TRPM8 channel-associated factor 2-like [Macrobrachium rosenbergii]|uniref:TRPM8 channel-associated factor 2-like n=1 Tax=Macrobrachium rosenbergii TaxID=79674 RepID=UPI0034D56807